LPPFHKGGCNITPDFADYQVIQADGAVAGQLGRCAAGDQLSVMQQSDPVTTRRFIQVGGGHHDRDPFRFEIGQDFPEIAA